ncbi:hypothetical protein CGZ80_26765 [Rhodopirellula sp. MGV]|nr:hypothetical protein CGZ80_26765 [Rhodopirellula sp. MGV]PNY38714.1 hypothetical protein C2E31_02020 [Rhodopirellula baltica]
MIAVTWPLWLPRPLASGVYPTIGFIASPTSVANRLEFAGAVAAIGTLIAIASGRVTARWWWLVSIGLVVLVSTDQQRLQPWCYQTIAYGLLFAFFDWRSARLWITLITASIYLYSAAGKLDYQFTHSVGQQMVLQALQMIPGITLDESMARLATRLAITLPIVELCIGAMILAKPTRRYGGMAAIAMHLSLFALLGPWSLNHSFGVLCWNLLLAVQSWMLFVNPADGGKDIEPEVDRRKALSPWSRLVRTAVMVWVVVMLVAPLTERWGIWDHWTSWSLYSPHTSRATVEIHDSAVARLPDELVRYLNDTDGDRWSRLSLEDWSIGERWVPVYPQARFQVEVAESVSRTYDLGQAIRVELRSVSDRVSGQRTSRYLIGRDEITRAADGYWFPIGRSKFTTNQRQR